MFLRKIFLSLLAISLLIASVDAATTFPYLNATLQLPGMDSPYPGLGTNYSTLGTGIRAVMWNPAGLAKIKVSEAYFGATATAASSSDTKNYSMTDTAIGVSGSGTGFANRFLYTDDLTAVNIATREFVSSAVYAPSSSGLDYKQAIKISDTFALGISSRGNTSAALNLQGAFPSQIVSNIDLIGTTGFLGSGISVNNDGKFSYSYTPSAGSPYIYTSEAAAYSGFLNQTQRIPLSAQTNSFNNFNVQSNLTFTGAGKWNGLSAGVNMTPIAASINVDNDINVIVKNGTSDPYYLVPNFDPNNEADVLQWINNPNLYGTEAGYNKSYIRVPAGESIAEAKYAGFYQASSIRQDFGLMYDLGEFITVGAAFENINGATLNFKGAGRVAYVNTRINTGESSGSVLDPANSTVWKPISDTFTPMEDTENIGMLSEINIPLPQRTKIGFTLRKPFLITFDYETQNSPLKFRVNDSNGNPTDAILTNIRILRGGMESQVLFLPMWLRGSLALMWKPEVSGLDAQGIEDYKKYFPLLNRFLPLSFDLGIGFKPWGYEMDAAIGADGSTLLSLAQADTLNSNFSKILYYNLGLKKDNWHATLQNNLDLIATASSVSGMTQAQKDAGQWQNFIKWVSTLTIGFEF